MEVLDMTVGELIFNLIFAAIFWAVALIVFTGWRPWRKDQ